MLNYIGDTEPAIEYWWNLFNKMHGDSMQDNSKYVCESKKARDLNSRSRVYGPIFLNYSSIFDTTVPSFLARISPKQKLDIVLFSG